MDCFISLYPGTLTLARQQPGNGLAKLLVDIHDRAELGRQHLSVDLMVGPIHGRVVAASAGAVSSNSAEGFEIPKPPSRQQSVAAGSQKKRGRKRLASPDPDLDCE